VFCEVMRLLMLLMLLGILMWFFLLWVGCRCWSVRLRFGLVCWCCLLCWFCDGVC